MTRLAPYTEQHQDPQGPGDARPTAVQIIKDQGLIASPSWAGRVVLITGCSAGGLGPETAKAIHLTGADVFITARDVAKGKQIAEEVSKDGMPGKVEVIEMDLNSLRSVRAGAEEFLRRSENKLNILINNAGTFHHGLSRSRLTHHRSHVLPRRQDRRWIRAPSRHEPPGYAPHTSRVVNC